MKPSKDILLRDKKAETLWNRASLSYQNYQEYIRRKGAARFDLNLLDLLYISNFKGGNASIHEEEATVKEKLIPYTDALKCIRKAFGTSALSDLSPADLESLISIVNKTVLLIKKKETGISGLGASYLSALLHAYFPTLIPILDRRVLLNMGIVSQTHLIRGQVKEIAQFYRPLIEKTAELCRETGKSLREIDRDYFLLTLSEGRVPIHRRVHHNEGGKGAADRGHHPGNT